MYDMYLYDEEGISVCIYGICMYMHTYMYV